MGGLLCALVFLWKEIKTVRIFRIRLHSKQGGRVYRLAQADFSGFAKGLQPVLGDPYSETSA